MMGLACGLLFQLYLRTLITQAVKSFRTPTVQLHLLSDMGKSDVSLGSVVARFHYGLFIGVRAELRIIPTGVDKYRD